MGNFGGKNENNNVVIKDAIQLKIFFEKYEDTAEKEDLLQYIPIGCNYQLYPHGVAEPISLFGFFATSSFVQPYDSLSFQMNLTFCQGCRIKISKKYNQKLIEFSKKTKTKLEIIMESYKNK